MTWLITILTAALAVVMAFKFGFTMGYDDGVRDRKMKECTSNEQKAVLKINHIDICEFPVNSDRPLEFELRVEDLYKAKAEEPSDER